MTQSELVSEKQTPQELKREALQIREYLREARHSERMAGFPIGKRWLYGMSIFGMLGVAFVLLVSDPIRQSAIHLAAGAFINLDVEDNRVFELPPPPPVATETKKGPAIQFQGSTIKFTDQGFEGVLYADTEPAAVETKSKESGEQGFVATPQTPEAESAFAMLKEKSPLAAQIVAGENAGYQFKEWSPVKVDPPVFYIDLLATRLSSGVDTHLIWEVNTEAGSVAPMSQAARDLGR